MPQLEITDNDIFLLHCAVENMRSAPEGDEQRASIIDARWRIAYDLEQLAKRADAAMRAPQQE